MDPPESEQSAILASEGVEIERYCGLQAYKIKSKAVDKDLSIADSSPQRAILYSCGIRCAQPTSVMHAPSLSPALEPLCLSELLPINREERTDPIRPTKRQLTTRFCCKVMNMKYAKVGSVGLDRCLAFQFSFPFHYYLSVSFHTGRSTSTTIGLLYLPAPFG